MSAYVFPHGPYRGQPIDRLTAAALDDAQRTCPMDDAQFTESRRAMAAERERRADLERRARKQEARARAAANRQANPRAAQAARDAKDATRARAAAVREARVQRQTQLLAVATPAERAAFEAATSTRRAVPPAAQTLNGGWRSSSGKRRMPPHGASRRSGCARTGRPTLTRTPGLCSMPVASTSRRGMPPRTGPIP